MTPKNHKSLFGEHLNGYGNIREVWIERRVWSKSEKRGQTRLGRVTSLGRDGWRHHALKYMEQDKISDLGLNIAWNKASSPDFLWMTFLLSSLDYFALLSFNKFRVMWLHRQIFKQVSLPRRAVSIVHVHVQGLPPLRLRPCSRSRTRCKRV